VTAAAIDVHAYYRQVTDVDIGEVARELLGRRITQESARTLFCDCPNHRSQSHRSLHVWLDKQGWFCHACGVGGDVLQLVEFIQHGGVTPRPVRSMPESHRQARDFLAARVGLPPLSQLGRSPEELSAVEEDHCLTLRVRRHSPPWRVFITSGSCGTPTSSRGFGRNTESGRKRRPG